MLTTVDLGLLHPFMRVCAELPILAATYDAAAQREGCSASCSITIRRAQARTSGEHLFVVALVTDPTFQKLGSPAKPRRFRSADLISLGRYKRAVNITGLADGLLRK